MSKDSLKSQAYTAIKEKIIHCEYAPGLVLNEEILCEELNVSRTPIRDALGRLEQEGLILIMPKKGVMVSQISIDEINNIFELRLLLEPYCLTNYGHGLDNGALLDFYQNFTSIQPSSNSKELFILDDDFHNTVIHLSPNPYIQKLYNTIYNQNLRFRIMTGQRGDDRLLNTRKEHLEIVKACIKKDWKSAGEAMYEHLLQSKNATFDLLLSKGKDLR